jgi:DNA-binding NtrC family response regulator
MPTKILLIEDSVADAKLLKKLLEPEAVSVETASEVEEALASVRANEFDVVLSDLHLGSETALELLPRLRDIRPHLPVIIMTAKHTTETAIEATRQGAYDYFPKPDVFEFTEGVQRSLWVTELLDTIERAAAARRLTAEVLLPDDTAFLRNEMCEERMIGRSRPMQDVFKAIGRSAASDITVLVRGETGTGKELAARALYSHSGRSKQPFIIINSAAIPEHLLESELFGHEKGAFTDAHARRIGRFEQADHGTIFLDEIGDMSFPLQQKLLRVLQEKTIERVGGKETIRLDVRVIAATHRNLEKAVQDSEFRQDLYFRLNVATITLPPLRERREDIPDLVQYFLKRQGAELGVYNTSIHPKAVDLLGQEPWPGNVRQLRNVVRKALLLARGMAIGPKIVCEALAQMVPPPPAADQPFSTYLAQLLNEARDGGTENVRATVMETVEREFYSQAIHRANGDQSKAARWLGVSRPTILEKLRKFGVHPGAQRREWSNGN